MSKRIDTAIFGKLQEDPSEVRDIKIYFDLFKDEKAFIDDLQSNDLNIEDLFYFANRCITPVGEMLLYHKLRHISKSNTAADNEKIIARIEDDGNFRGKIEGALSGLADRRNNFMSGLLNMSVKLGKWHKYFKFLPLLYIVVVAALWLFASPLAVLISCVAILAFNTCIHYWNKSYVETCIRPLVQLNKIRTAAVRLSKIDGYNSLANIDESVGELGNLSRKVSLFSLNRVVESEFMAVFQAVIEIAKSMLLIEPIMTNSILAKIGNINSHSKRLTDYLGEWDVLYSVSSLRVWMKQNNCHWTVPSFDRPGVGVRANEIYHPLIPDCVPNTIVMDKSVIITGSNMSGKSSFIKTIGVNIVAAYAINTCFAEQIVLPDCNLHSVLAVSDDINNSTSYYYSEARRIKSIIDKCKDSPSDRTNIVLIDEIFKGTNTTERISIANAVIKYLAGQSNTLAVVSSHDMELARSFVGILDTYHFSEEMSQDELRFNYKLIPGIEYTRNAISILRSCGYPEEIIAAAELNTQKVCENINSISL